MFNNKVIVSTIMTVATFAGHGSDALSVRDAGKNIDTKYVTAKFQEQDTVTVFRIAKFDLNYLKDTTKQWIQSTVGDEVTHTYTETQRDEWSVYLDRNDKAQSGVHVSLDMWRKVVVYCDNSGCKDYMQIQTADDKLNIEVLTETTDGNDAQYVVAGKNDLVYTEDNKIWHSRLENGDKFDYTENRRDAWSVYLHRSDYEQSGETMQLDLWRNVISMGNAELYHDYKNITEAGQYGGILAFQYIMRKLASIGGN